MDATGPQYAFAQALHQAVLDPERRDRTVVVDGTDVRLRFDPEPGVDIRIEAVEGADEMRHTVFHAADERPASYPPELPFLPGLGASVMSAGGADAGAQATWWGVADVEGAVAELRAQSAASGWTEGDETVLDFVPGLPPFRTLTFRRADGGERGIQVAPMGDKAMISVMHSAG